MEVDSIRSSFKECLGKLNQIDTRAHAFRDLQVLVSQNKTINNLRVWLSVFAQSRNKHSESQLQAITFIIKQYGKGLLDPIDKIPSLEKTIFRITELIIKFFPQNHQNVQLACQSAWLELYGTAMQDEGTEMKKKLLYNNIEAIINGGGGKMAQVTAQIVVEGLLQRALASEDHQFFKEIAKRTLVLFLKTTVHHPSTLTSLQTILGFFSIMNLLPLLDNIVSKILLYINASQPNSTGYKIKGEACNCLALIGEQIDSNGVPIYARVFKILSDLATDKVWAVQAPGRRALGIWKVKNKEWEQQFIEKNKKIGEEADQIHFGSKSPLANLKQNISEYPKTYQDNWMNNNEKQIQYIEEKNPHIKPSTDYNKPWVRSNNSRNKISQRTIQDHRQTSPSKEYLQKNTGMGGGNNIQSVQQYYQRQRPQQTYQTKMQELKKSIYHPHSDIQFEDTVVFGEERQQKAKNEEQEVASEEDDDFLQNWENVLTLAETHKFEESIKILLEMDDDIYFLRFFLKYSTQVLGELTRPTSNKVLRKMLQIKKTNFMEQMLFKMVAESMKGGIGQLLSNTQNLVIINHLQNCKKAEKLKDAADKLCSGYQRSLDN